MPTKVRRFRVIDGKTGDAYTVVDLRRTEVADEHETEVVVEQDKTKQKPK